MIRPNDIFMDMSGSVVDQLRESNRQIINDVVLSLGLTSTTEAIADANKLGSTITIANGDYGGFLCKNAGSIYKGIGAASKVTKPVTIDADCIIDGVYFTGGSGLPGNLVSISVGCVVVFRNCVFEKISGDGGSYVSLAPPVGAVVAKANLIGCVFQGPNSGAVVNNPGAAANVNTIGCYDRTGGGFAGTTGVGNL